MRLESHNNNNLERLESLERKLSKVLDGADGSDYSAMSKIYSNIINNAELASQKISANDPLKKQWYKKVLQYQIKEKHFRELHHKQEQKKLEQKQAERENMEAGRQPEVPQAAPPSRAPPHVGGQVMQQQPPQYYDSQAPMQERMAYMQYQDQNQIPDQFMQTSSFQPPQQQQYQQPQYEYQQMPQQQMQQQPMRQMPQPSQQFAMQQMMVQQTQQLFSALTNMITTTLEDVKLQKYDDSSDMVSFSKYSGVEDNVSNKMHHSRAATQRDPRFLLHNPYQDHENEKVGVGGGGSGHSYHDGDPPAEVEHQAVKKNPYKPKKIQNNKPPSQHSLWGNQGLLSKPSERSDSKVDKSLQGYSQWEPVGGTAVRSNHGHHPVNITLPQTTPPSSSYQVTAQIPKNKYQQLDEQVPSAIAQQQQRDAMAAEITTPNSMNAVKQPLKFRQQQQFDEYLPPSIPQQQPYETEQLSKIPQQRQLEQEQRPSFPQQQPYEQQQRTQIHQQRQFEQDQRTQNPTQQSYEQEQWPQQRPNEQEERNQYNQPIYDGQQMIRNDPQPVANSDVEQPARKKRKQQQFEIVQEEVLNYPQHFLPDGTEVPIDNYEGNVIIDGNNYNPEQQQYQQYEAPQRSEDAIVSKENHSLPGQSKWEKIQSQMSMKEIQIDEVDEHHEYDNQYSPPQKPQSYQEFQPHRPQGEQIQFNNQKEQIHQSLDHSSIMQDDSLEFNNQDMTEVERKKLRLQKKKMNHLRRLNTIEAKRKSESPFISNQDFTSNLMQNNNRVHSKDGAPSLPFQSDRLSRIQPDMQSEHSEVNPFANRVYEPARKPPLRQQNEIIQPQKLGTPVNNVEPYDTNQFFEPQTQSHNRQSEKMQSKHHKKLMSEFPPEVANDTMVKQQLLELAEKQMKIIQDYKNDIERLAQENQRIDFEHEQSVIRGKATNAKNNNPPDEVAEQIQAMRDQARSRKSSAQQMDTRNIPKRPIVQDHVNTYPTRQEEKEVFNYVKSKIQLNQKWREAWGNNDNRITNKDSQRYERPFYDDDQNPSQPMKNQFLKGNSQAYQRDPRINIQSLSSLMTADADQLFIVEKQSILPRPKTGTKVRTLADEEMVGIDDFHQIMRNNIQFENIVRKDLMWRNFEILGETQKQENLYALVEQYFLHLLTSDYSKYQVPIFARKDVARKLRSISNQLLDTLAYLKMAHCHNQEQLYQGIEDALAEIGEMSMGTFIQQEIEAQIQLKVKVEGDGNRTGVVPRSLQYLMLPNSQRVGYHFLQQQKQNESVYEPLYQSDMKYIGDYNSENENSDAQTEAFEVKLFHKQEPVKSGAGSVRRSNENIRLPIIDNSQRNSSQQQSNDPIQEDVEYEPSIDSGEEQFELYDEQFEGVPDPTILVSSPMKSQNRSSQIIPPNFSPEELILLRNQIQQKTEQTPAPRLSQAKIQDLLINGRILTQTEQYQESPKSFKDFLSPKVFYNATTPKGFLGIKTPKGMSNGTTPKVMQSISTPKVSYNSPSKRGEVHNQESFSMMSYTEQARSPQEEEIQFTQGQNKLQQEWPQQSLNLESTLQIEPQLDQHTSQMLIASFEDKLYSMTDSVGQQLSIIIEHDNENLSRESSGAVHLNIKRSIQSSGNNSKRHLMVIEEEKSIPSSATSPKKSSHAISPKKSTPALSPKNKQSATSLRRPSISALAMGQLNSIVLHEIKAESTKSESTKPRNSVAFQSRNFQELPPQSQSQKIFELPPLPINIQIALSKKKELVSESDKRLNRAVRKHMQFLQQTGPVMQSAYEQFEQQWFNNVKDATASKYFISNEQKYRKYNFNDNQMELEMKFRAKEEHIEMENTRKIKTDAQKLYEKVQQFKNPLINELFLEQYHSSGSTPTESQRQSETLSAQMARYHEECIALKNEMLEVLDIQNHNEVQRQEIRQGQLPTPYSSSIESSNRISLINTGDISKQPTYYSVSNQMSQSHSILSPNTQQRLNQMYASLENPSIHDQKSVERDIFQASGYRNQSNEEITIDEGRSSLNSALGGSQKRNQSNINPYQSIVSRDFITNRKPSTPNIDNKVMEETQPLSENNSDPHSDKSSTFRKVWSNLSTYTRLPPIHPRQPYGTSSSQNDQQSIQNTTLINQDSVEDHHRPDLVASKYKDRKMSINSQSQSNEKLLVLDQVSRKLQTFVESSSKSQRGKSIHLDERRNSFSKYSNSSFGDVKMFVPGGDRNQKVLTSLKSYKSTFTLGAANR